MERKANALLSANSPYLLQHAYNPVAWREWSAGVFEEARRENKLVLISIGYAACHWCHVMEHETFENEAAAQLMNEHFICVKVDREERPDVDQVYMDAVQIMTGQGGWPLNCFTLPDGRPIHGGTYFPREHWMDVLKQLAQVFKNQPEEVEKYAERLLGGMKILEKPKAEQGSGPNTPAEAYRLLFNQFDPQEGGMGMAPKFPMPPVFNFLLDFHVQQNEPSSLAIAELALRKMAAGGIYDHVGGGFARYSVDQQWLVPHFEKMLYDNAQLISLYVKAYRITGSPDYLRVAQETARFVKRELMDQDGRFYSSLDADSEGVEGKFYCWSMEELRELLGVNAELFARVYGCTEDGNWEEGNILHLPKSIAASALELNRTEADLREQLEACNAVLLKAREQRVRPGLDDKIILSWNAMMISALLQLHSADPHSGWLQDAIQAINSLTELHCVNEKWFRISRRGKVAIPAFHDDLAFLGTAFMELGSATGDVTWFNKAEKVLEDIRARFWIPAEQRYGFAPNDGEQLVVNKTEYHDGVIASSSAVMAHFLYRMGFICGRPAYIEEAKLLLDSVAGRINQHPGSFAHWWDLQLLNTTAFHQWIITGPEAEAWATVLPQRFNHFSFATIRKQEHALLKDRQGNTTSAYHCTGFSCGLPITSLEILKEEAANADTIHQ